MWLLLWYITRPKAEIDIVLSLVVVGSGMLLFRMRHQSYLRRKLRHIRKRAARKAMELDPEMCWPETREVVVEFCLGSDLRKIEGRPWEARLREVLGKELCEAGGLFRKKEVWERVIASWVWLLEMARIRWGEEKRFPDLRKDADVVFSGLKDEEILDTLLGATVVISGLFRAHLLLWGVPQSPWTRENIAKIRAEWIPFSAIRPTHRMFPPSLPREVKDALYQNLHLLSARASCRQLVSFVNHVNDRDE